MTDIVILVLCFVFLLIGAILVFILMYGAVNKLRTQRDNLIRALHAAGDTIMTQNEELYSVLKKSLENDDKYIN